MDEEILSLSRNLRQEEVFVRQERDLIERVHRDLSEVRYRELIQQLYILLSERWFVEDVFTHSTEVQNHSDSPNSQIQSQTARFLEISCVRFVESRCAGLDYTLEIGYAEFLEKLRQRPVLVGQLLTYCEEVCGAQQLSHLVRNVFSSLYAGCLTAEDEQSVLHLLKYLVDVQVAMHDNPRKLLQKENCAFSRLFQLYVEHLPAAKVYLTSALYQPLVSLLMEDTWYYDMDEQVMMSRFRPEKAIAVFGNPGTEDHRRRKERYKETLFQKLVQLADNFVQSLRATASAFPPTLLWLVGQLSCLVSNTGKVDRVEVAGMCADVVFSRFISPAICEPEKFGIAGDLAISKIARYNLMQISKVIQVLSSMTGLSQVPEPKELFGRFETSCLTSLTACLLEVAETMSTGPPPVSPLSLPSSVTPVASASASAMSGPLVSRTVAPVTRQGLQLLIDTVRQYAERLPAGCADRITMDTMTTGLPPEVPDNRHVPARPAVQEPSSSSPRPKLKFPTLSSSGRSSRSPVSSTVRTPDRSHSPELDDIENGSADPQEVILLSLDPANTIVGGSPDVTGLLMPEAKVLEAQAAAVAGRKSARVSNAVESAESMQASGAEKRTRFSLSHDQESVGTTSDYLEGVSEVAASEVASYHSAASYESQEDEADGLSDMISANVSGRGTPSISGGRDSPLSGADLPTGPPVVVHKPPPDVTEKFGKFDIPQTCRPQENESRSVISDTWSTDVQGSADSEANAQDRLEEIAEEMDHWSVDATCDGEDKVSERMLEFDIDDFDDELGAQRGRRRRGNGDNEPSSSVDDLEVIRQQQHRQERSHRTNSRATRPNLAPSNAAMSLAQLPQASAQQQKKNRGIQWLPGPPQQQQSVECESNAGSVVSEPAWSSAPSSSAAPMPPGSRPGSRKPLEASGDSRKPRSGSLREQRIKDRINNNNSATAKGADGEIAFYDPANLEKCLAFLDAKRKLRLVLSASCNWGTGLNLAGTSSLLPSTPMMAVPPQQPFSNLINFNSASTSVAGSSSSSTTSSSGGGRRGGSNVSMGGSNALVRSLRMQIAMAINMQETERLARLQETLRIVRLFDSKGCLRLLTSMERDWRLRQAYVAYLTRTRQHLCLQREEVDAAARRVACDRRICSRFLTRLCVDRFLAAYEREVADFHSRFARPPRDSLDRHNTEDVKRELMESILNRLFREMENHSLWRGASAAQLEDARTYLERMLFSRVYYEAMFLNDYEADKQRDELLHRELEILSDSVTENHPDIAISRQFHCVVPFQHAQEELRLINVYKTPAEKVRCIVRTANVIGSLLMLSSDGQTSGADEIFPVLLYVLIKVNPPMLKATIQFVETFYEERFVNFEYYWWTTFKAVVNQTTRMLAVPSEASVVSSTTTD